MKTGEQGIIYGNIPDRNVIFFLINHGIKEHLLFCHESFHKDYFALQCNGENNTPNYVFTECAIGEYKAD